MLDAGRTVLGRYAERLAALSVPTGHGRRLHDLEGGMNAAEHLHDSNSIDWQVVERMSLMEMGISKTRSLSTR
jgi:hypothetical protein